MLQTSQNDHYLTGKNSTPLGTVFVDLEPLKINKMALKTSLISKKVLYTQKRNHSFILCHVF